MARDVRYLDFQAFVDAKGLERPCVECGANDWQMLGSDETPKDDEAFMFLASLPEVSDSGIPSRAFSNYIMYCGSCGVIKLVAAGVVWDWLESRGG